MRSQSAARRILLILLLPLLAACIGEEREQTLGDEIARELNARAPLVRDAGLSGYVQRLGSELAEVSARPDVPYRFYIVNSPDVNAFALPGGHIYVTRGLIERTENSSQLGAVLAHEIGHVAARHGARQLERHLRTGSVVTVMYRLILGSDPPLLEQQALRLGTRVWSARHSRRAEREADRLAVRYLIDAGVNPGGIVSFLKRLREEEAERPHFAAEWFSTHPLTSNRIDLLQREIRSRTGLDSAKLATDVASYPAFLRRLESLPAPVYDH